MRWVLIFAIAGLGWLAGHWLALNPLDAAIYGSIWTLFGYLYGRAK